MPSRRSIAAAVVSVLIAVSLVAAPAGAETAEDRRAAERAAAQIATAQRQADQAAADWSTAQSEYDTLSTRLVDLEVQEAASQARVDGLKGSASQVALLRYMSPDVNSLPFTSSAADASDRLRADGLATFVSRGHTQAFDEFVVATQDLAADRAAVAATKDDTADALNALEDRQADLADRIEDLREAEEVRQDAQAVREAREAEVARQAAAARQAEDARRQAAAAAAAAARPTPSAASSSGHGSASPAANGAPSGASASNDDDAADSADSGGGAAPAPPVTQGRQIVCPVAGTVAFTDTWGASRSGGRSHKGVDMMGTRGTRLVAVVSGNVRQSTSGLGGRQVWLKGNDGHTYFYAHLDGYAGGGGAVSAGQLVGYLGDTGNARGTPHLHFEYHPGGGGAVNPYPLVAANC